MTDDIDAVYDRLTWHDDDIVLMEEFGPPINDEDLLSREQASHLNSTMFHRRRTNGGVKVLRPFLSSDGVLFKPE